MVCIGVSHVFVPSEPASVTALDLAKAVHHTASCAVARVHTLKSRLQLTMGGTAGEVPDPPASSLAPFQ